MTNFISRLFKQKDNNVYSPIAGKSVHLSESKDPVFKDGLMGEGCFIIPKSDGSIYAPITGEITMVFPTKHAYGIKSDEDLELLIHVGVNTVELNGTFFKSYVKKGDKVNAGDLIAEFNIAAIIEKGYASDVFLLVPEKKIEEFEIVYGDLSPKDQIFIL